MNPYYQKNDITIYHGNALNVLKAMPDESVQLIISSPPYFSLRDYKLEPQVWDGDKDCVHLWTNSITANRHKKGETNPGKKAWYKEKDGISQTAGCFCSKCGAWKGNLGLEPSVNLFLHHLLQITAELKRVLKKNGQFWLNISDSCGGSGMGISYAGITCGPNSILKKNELNKFPATGHSRGKYDKCLLQIPERLSTKMVDEQGWILRNDIIWVKQILIKKTSNILGDYYTLRKDLTKEQKEYVLKELAKYNLI